VQAGFGQKLQLFNLKFKLNKFVSAFSFGHNNFMQVGFVTLFVLPVWLRLDKETFCRCKLFSSFVAVTSF
jgi:hypothetical protein